MKRLINTSLALVLVSALGIAATGSAFAQSGQTDFDAEMQRAPQPEVYTAPASPGMYESKRMEYIPRNMEGSSGGIVGVVTLVGDDMIKLVEADTGITHEIRVTDAQEKALTTGFLINAYLSEGRLVSYQEMGIPQDVKEVVYTSEHLPDVNILEQPRGYRFQPQPDRMEQQQPYIMEQPDPYGNF